MFVLYGTSIMRTSQFGQSRLHCTIHAIPNVNIGRWYQLEFTTGHLKESVKIFMNNINWPQDRKLSGWESRSKFWELWDRSDSTYEVCHGGSMDTISLFFILFDGGKMVGNFFTILDSIQFPRFFFSISGVQFPL